jgi:hypothetical protein
MYFEGYPRIGTGIIVKPEQLTSVKSEIHIALLEQDRSVLQHIR